VSFDFSEINRYGFQQSLGLFSIHTSSLTQDVWIEKGAAAI